MFIQDCFASDNSTVLVDKTQKLVLLEGVEINGYTILKFKRKLFGLLVLQR